MPEGDTLARTADGLRPHLIGRTVVAARARSGAQAGRLVGARIDAVEALGKNLLMRFSNGLEVRTHLRMHGTWHRYRPGERWRRPAGRAVLVIEVEGAVAVCFDAPVVELFEARAERIHPALARLGPDLLAAEFDAAEGIRRFRGAAGASTAIGEALLDQRIVAGIGNIYRSEVLFLERVDPFLSTATLDDVTLERIVMTARRLLRAGAGRAGGPAGGGPARVAERAGARAWVYGRAGRPCRRCGTLVRSSRLAGVLPRPVYWCPACQAVAPAERPLPVGAGAGPADA
ncbi:MAG TPA: DNA-formamidopyrimidine glycosylase family protein [Candidatus Limnocylindria bacterium]|nr:DNA-formamidopyrimidine glycosylase family protein [Candidatus Limnocylindria bacterium]